MGNFSINKIYSKVEILVIALASQSKTVEVVFFFFLKSCKKHCKFSFWFSRIGVPSTVSSLVESFRIAMENSENDEPDKKRPHLTSVSSRSAMNKTVTPFSSISLSLSNYGGFASAINVWCSVDIFLFWILMLALNCMCDWIHRAVWSSGHLMIRLF